MHDVSESCIITGEDISTTSSSDEMTGSRLLLLILGLSAGKQSRLSSDDADDVRVLRNLLHDLLRLDTVLPRAP
jgi:hypothetical protein